MTPGFESPNQRVNPVETRANVESTKTQLSTLKEQVEESAIFSQLGNAKDRFEDIFTKFGAKLQKAAEILAQGKSPVKIPKMLEMLVLHYAGHYKTQLSTIGNVLKIEFDWEKEAAAGMTPEKLAIEAKKLTEIAKLRHPTAKNPMEALAAELQGKPIGSVMDVVKAVAQLPKIAPAPAAPVTPPAAPASDKAAT